MQPRSNLFRSEAKPLSGPDLQGSIAFISPVYFLAATGTTVLIALIVVCFFIAATYTQRSTLTGQLAPEAGILKLYTPQFGTVIEKYVVEGRPVHQGDILYVMSSERRSTTLGDMQKKISEQVTIRQHSLQDAASQLKRLSQSDQDSAKKKLQGLEAEYAAVEDLLVGLRQRVALAEQTEARYANLTKQGYLSKNDALIIQADLLDQRTRLQTLERDRISLQRQIDEQQSVLRELPIRYQNQIAELERSVASTEQELTQSEAARQWVVTAPQDGIATSVIGEVGQTVDSSQPLLSIVPKGSVLQAQLYAPSRSIGFVKTGDKVYLRYQAYPYQKFGHYAGTVASVSRTASPASELTGSNLNLNNNEPVYRITVDLNAQHVTAYGKPQALQAGMLLEADVLQETRRLYEWVLEPLITLTGKVH